MPGSVIGSCGDAHLVFGATVAEGGQEACEARDASTRTPGSFWCPTRLCGDVGGGAAGCGGQEPVAAGPDPAAAAEVTMARRVRARPGGGALGHVSGPLRLCVRFWWALSHFYELALPVVPVSLAGFCSEGGRVALQPQSAQLETGARTPFPKSLSAQLPRLECSSQKDSQRSFLFRERIDVMRATLQRAEEFCRKLFTSLNKTV